MIDPRTEDHIRLGQTRPDQPTVWVCGCEYRLVNDQGLRRWYLCGFHEGFDDALWL